MLEPQRVLRRSSCVWIARGGLWPSMTPGAVPVELLSDAFVDRRGGRAGRPDGELRERTRRGLGPPGSPWAGGAESRVHVRLAAKGNAGSLVAVEHARLADAGETERMRAF